MKRKRRKLFVQRRRERCYVGIRGVSGIRGGDGVSGGNGLGSSGRRIGVKALSNASGVSRAMWPAKLRQSAALGKNAQRRRALKCLWWSVRVYLSQVPLLYVWFAVALLVAGSFLLLLVLQQRHTFVIAAMVGAVAIVHLVSSNLIRFVRSRLIPFVKERQARVERSGSMGYTEPIKLPVQVRRQPMQDAAVMRTPRLSLLLHAPETPMPEPPLIRVLETIDLSSCDVEHFLGPETETALESFHSPDKNTSLSDEYTL